MEISGRNFTKTAGFFIVPIIIWVAYYGFLLIKTSAFTLFWSVDVLAAAAPYLFLWIISSRFPVKAKWCKVASVVIFSLTVLVGIIKYFLSRNAEEATNVFLVPFFQVIVIWVLGVFTLIGMVMMLRRRNTLTIAKEV